MTDFPNPQNLVNAKELDARIRRVDEDRWLASRYAPADGRYQLMALYAFNHELERALGMSEPMLGQIRVQWWREVVEQIFSDSDVRRHDVAQALGEAIVGRAQMRPRLDGLLNAYDDVLEGRENADFPPRIEIGAKLVLAAAELIGRDFAQHENALADCGRAYVAALTGSPCAPARLEMARTAFQAVPVPLAPVVMAAALAPQYIAGRSGGLEKRWRIFNAALRGKL